MLTTLPPGFVETPVVSGLSAGTAMEFSPDGRLFVLEQGGNVKLVHSDGTTFTALHLNVDSNGERGLLGIAFDPNYNSNHFVYLYYTNPNPGGASWATGVHNQLSRFTVNDTNPLQPTFGSEAPILDWNNLVSATNHNGGAIHFGIDGMLYADAGDNTQTFVQGANTYRVSQTLSNLLGKQLRINVSAFNSGLATRDDTTVGHLIPANNPFVGTATGINQLIYVLGLRNPYTFAVQPGTGTIYVNDVGENTWEEIDQSIAGGNYGWSGGNTDGFGQTPPGPGTYHDPLLAYNHSGGPAGGGIAIVGGTFYNPTTDQFPASYVGKYFYEDLGNAWIRVFDPSNPGSAANPDTSSAFATGLPGGLHDLKVDSAGNLYYLGGNGGLINKISYQPVASNPVFVDDSTASYTETGPGWTTWSGGYNGEQRYVAAGTGGSTASWVVSGLPSGSYTVQATWFANSDHATNAPYQLFDGSNPIQTVNVDQTQLPNGPVFGNQAFQTVATVNVTSGTLKVVLSNNANGFVMADALRVSVSAPTPPITLPAILDDGANGYSQSGRGWQLWPAGYGGDLRYVAAGTGSATAGWQVTGLAAGNYVVQATWLPASNHATNAPYQIFDGANLVQTVLVDQTQAPSGTTFGGEPFQTLSVVHVTSGTLKVVLSNNGNGYVNADAIRVDVSAAAPPPPPPVIVDDLTNGYTESGPGWTTWLGGYGGDQRYVAAGTGASTASWQVNGLPTGDYTVQATWFAHSDHASNAPYQIFDGATLLQTVLVDQRQQPSGTVFGNEPFQTLATVHITSGTLRVVLSNNADGYVLADAIREAAATPAPPPTLPAIVDDGTDGYSQTGPGWLSWPSGYGGEQRYVAAGTGASTASWQLTGLATGDYTVQTTWFANTDHATNAPYELFDGSTLLQTVFVNQTLLPSGPTFGSEPFQTLATVHITTGTLKVLLSNNANGYVLADAIRVS